MTQQTESFVVADPRSFDGDPYEVAERAVAQIEGIMRVLDAVLPATVLMVRNAELERQLALGQGPNVADYDDSVQSRKWGALQEAVRAARADLILLRRVASFNPKAAIKG